MGQQHQGALIDTKIDTKIEPQPGQGTGIDTINLGLQNEESCDGAGLPDRSLDFECLEEKNQVRTPSTKVLERDCALDIKVVG